MKNTRTQTHWIVPFLALTFCASVAQAQPFSFVKLVDSDTIIPDSGGKKFQASIAFSPVTLSGNRVAFRGTGPLIQGVYEWNSGALVRVADTSTPAPGGAGPFASLGAVLANSGDHIVFSGTDNVVSGLYQRRAGLLAKIVDDNTDAPNGGKFFGPGAPSVQGDSIAFRARHTSGQTTPPAVYRWDSGTLSTVADTDTPVPGGTGSFSGTASPQFRTVHLTQSTVSFTGIDSAGKTGIYRRDAGGLAALADTNTDAPAGLGKFAYFDDFGITGSDLIVRAATQLGGPNDGLFTRLDGAWARLLTEGDPAPGGGTFGTLASLALQDGIAVFYDNANSAVYTNFGGTLQRVIGTGDMLDGKEVLRTFFVGDGRDGDRLAIAVDFTGHDPARGRYDEAIYLVSLPAPGVLAPLAAGGLLAARRRR
jgi:hypothetical protein